MEIKNKIIHSTDIFDIVHSLCEDPFHEMITIDYKVENVAIIPYTLDAANIINGIGIVNNLNPFKNSGLSVLIDSEHDSDDNSLDTAIRCLYDKTGYKVTDDSKWTYLKELHVSDIMSSGYTCYAVNITELKPEADENSLINSFKIVPVNKIISSNNGLAISLLLKLYVSLFGNIFAIKKQF